MTHDGWSAYCAGMFPPFQPLELLLVIFAGWVNRRQLDVIEYLQEENRVLKERLGGRPFVSLKPNALDSPEKRSAAGS